MNIVCTLRFFLRKHNRLRNLTGNRPGYRTANAIFCRDTLFWNRIFKKHRQNYIRKLIYDFLALKKKMENSKKNCVCFDVCWRCGVTWLYHVTRLLPRRRRLSWWFCYVVLLSEPRPEGDKKTWSIHKLYNCLYFQFSIFYAIFISRCVALGMLVSHVF